MRAISKTKHEHLTEALLLLEKLLLAKEGLKVHPDTETESMVNASLQMILRDAQSAREELEELFVSYNVTLDTLSATIARYDALYNYLRLDIIGKRLKELKRQMPVTDEQFEILRNTIHTAYGT